jgi:hypothetical protein
MVISNGFIAELMYLLWSIFSSKTHMGLLLQSRTDLIHGYSATVHRLINRLTHRLIHNKSMHPQALRIAMNFCQESLSI